MIGFLIKKNFYDSWDNLFKIAIVNIGFIASIAIPVFVPGFFASLPFLGMITMLIGILWSCVYLSAAALSVKRISDYGNFGFADFIGNLKTNWPAGLVFGGMVFLIYLLCTIVIPFYLSMRSTIGLLLAVFIFWTMITSILALQFFLAVTSRLEKRLFVAVKKCFIIFFGNTMFCVFSLLHNIFLLAICLFPLFIFVPGPAGMLLFLDQGLRLRLMKYDWLEQNPGSDSRKIPWDAILIEEREKTGSRSLKNFIFPWKD